MLDIKFIKENRGIVEKAITDKKKEAVDLDRVISLYENRSLLRGQIDDLNRQRNEAAAKRDIEAGRSIKEKLQTKEEELRQVEQEFLSLMVKIPNIPSPDTPIGPDDSGNQIIRSWGQKTEFAFDPQAHWDLGKKLGIIDSEKAAEVAGSRFTYIKGDLALLQLAVINLVFQKLTDIDWLKETALKAGVEVKLTPFIPIFPPAMIKPQVLNRMARLDPKEDKYYLEKDDLYLAGSAEHTVGPLHMDETLAERDLPLRYVGYSTAFRREAGSYGKDTKGILRMHQFDKIEMETFCLPENSIAEQDFLVAIQEGLMQMLGLPYQVVAVCTGDMGFPDQRQIDIETWMPGQSAYRETHSADLIGSFQPRRLNIKVKRDDGRTDYVHMNDATAFAIGRILIAIIENYQTAEGGITIAPVLLEWVGKYQIVV